MSRWGLGERLSSRPAPRVGLRSLVPIKLAALSEESANYVGGMFAAMRMGDESMPVGMNDAVSSITSIKTCQEIVDDIAAGFTA